MPFLKTYYTEFYRKDECVLEGNTTNSTYTALLVRIIRYINTLISSFVFQNLYTPLLNCKRVYFTHELQVKLYYRVFFLIMPNVTNPQVSVYKNWDYIDLADFSPILEEFISWYSGTSNKGGSISLQTSLQRWSQIILCSEVPLYLHTHEEVVVAG